jgi:hypothetical protein
MPYRLEGFAGIGLSEALLELLIEEHRRDRLPALEMLWRYFRNPLEPAGVTDDRPGRTTTTPRRYRAGQEVGLPPRLTGEPDPDAPLVDDRAKPRREVVVENDIGWRIQTMVDFMFGAPLQITSTAPDEARRREIERVIDAVWEASGGIGLLQDAALLGNVFGYVDFVVRLNERGLIGGPTRVARALDAASGTAMANLIKIETIDPRRGVPVLNRDDYRKIDGYVVHFERELNEVQTRRARARASTSNRSARRWTRSAPCRRSRGAWCGRGLAT